MTPPSRPSRPSQSTQPAEPLLPTGEFSRRTGLSLKALRIYDGLGLLKPASVPARSRPRGDQEGPGRPG